MEQKEGKRKSAARRWMMCAAHKSQRSLSRVVSQCTRASLPPRRVTFVSHLVSHRISFRITSRWYLYSAHISKVTFALHIAVECCRISVHSCNPAPVQNHLRIASRVTFSSHLGSLSHLISSHFHIASRVTFASRFRV